MCIRDSDYGDGVEVEMVQVQDGTNVQITLAENLEHFEYTVTWTPNDPEEPITLVEPDFYLPNLEPGETYTFTFTATCLSGGYKSDPISVEVIIPEEEFPCIDAADTPLPDNCQPATNLFIGDVVTIGDFQVTISDVTNVGSGGQFSGSGHTTIPYLNSIQIEFEFTNITIQNLSLIHI